MAYYRCGPTAIGSRTSWGPVSSPTVEKSFERPLSGNFDRIFNAFERTNAFEYVRNSFEGKDDERHIGHGDIVVNRSMSSSFERADCALAAQTPILEDEDFYREKILYSQARQLFPLQEDLADWINKTVGITYLTGENFLDVLDNGAELCQLAAVIQERARDALDRGLIVGPVPQVRGRWWQRAARRSFFSRDNTEIFLTFCRDLGVHENLLFESDDLVVHNQPRQVILCLLEVSRLATRYDIEPPGLVQLEKEIALEERDCALESTVAAWQFRGEDTKQDKSSEDPPPSPDPNDSSVAVPDNVDNESTPSEGGRSEAASSDSDVPLKPTNELDKRVQLVSRLLERGCRCSGRCSRLLKVKKVGEGRYNIAGRNVFIRLLKGRHMMVRVGGGWDTLEHFLSRHEPCQVRLVSGRSHPLTINNSLDTSSTGLSKESSVTLSPVDSKASSISGKISPVARTEKHSTDGKVSPVLANGKTSPITRSDGKTRTSTPKPKSRTGLSLPLRQESVENKPKSKVTSSSTPNTPTGRTPRTPPVELRKSLTSNSLLNTPKKSRSMSLAHVRETEKSVADTRGKHTPAEPVGRKTRSQSLVSPGLPTKDRSVSAASTPRRRPSSITINGALTQAAIEETIRMSLAATIADEKPFLHIKAKYRSPPPREVPPR